MSLLYDWTGRIGWAMEKEFIDGNPGTDPAILSRKFLFFSLYFLRTVA
jgi:hypothetical protein